MTKKQIERLKSPRIRYLIAFSVLIMLTFIFIIIYQGTKEYKQAIEKGEENSIRLVSILGEHIELSFLGASLYLEQASKIKQNIEQIRTEFDSWLKTTPQIAGIALLDTNGSIKILSYKPDYKNWADFNYKILGDKLFDHIKNTSSGDIFIGKYESKNNKPLIIMSKRRSNEDGSFNGIVIAAIDPEYFINFYNSINYNDKQFMSIMLFDKTILAASTYKAKLNELLGRNFLAEQEKKQGAIYRRNVHSNDSDLIMALKILQNLPIAVHIVLDEDEYLTEWYQSRIRDIGILALFTIFGTILSIFALIMARQVIRVQESESAAILASQAKSEFLANMSHELRTPLNAIIGFSEMINSGYFGPLTTKQKERIYDINLCGSHLLQLISDILEFSKGDAGKLELVEEKVNISELINESTRIMKGKIKTKNIELLVRVEQGLPILLGDGRKIRQILINLLSNAFKFTPQNGNITVSANIDSERNMVLSVADSGIGIPENEIPKALSVFGQVHRTKNHEGTGLGLPLCKMHAELHGGKLILSSRQNEGTTVQIIFPHSRVLSISASV
ncbi:MAG: ATP-binding protein [Rickettsiales bacterium]